MAKSSDHAQIYLVQYIVKIDRKFQLYICCTCKLKILAQMLMSLCKDNPAKWVDTFLGNCMPLTSKCFNTLEWIIYHFSKQYLLTVSLGNSSANRLVCRSFTSLARFWLCAWKVAQHILLENRICFMKRLLELWCYVFLHTSQ